MPVIGQNSRPKIQLENKTEAFPQKGIEETKSGNNLHLFVPFVASCSKPAPGRPVFCVQFLARPECRALRPF
jgi:hypothetical protein